MNYSQDIYREAQQTLTDRRASANQKAAALKERMRRYVPRVSEIESEMAEAASQVIRAVLDGGDVEQTVEQIKQHNLALQAELADILERAGESQRDFEPQFFCPRCQDTGYTDRGMCDCYRELLQEIACQRLCRDSAMQPTSFDELSLDYYPDTAGENGVSPRRQMEGILQYCRQYADAFSTASPSLILRGPTGTGKTHCSLSIARQAAQRGYHVVYGPVQRLLHQVEREHFGKEDGDSEELLCRCDLLVLDDLGAEFTGPFYIASLYNILNARLLAGLPTLISTNLNMQQIQDRYGDAIASRIMGSFQPLVFCGKDIRQMKMQQRFG